ncbi:aldehyde dehydrogenase family protein [uncultured Cohaesibacter sp.]|uniref:aldehyde dehydrogenase family protein n=1 Tax=uncultured Cohaesibacter sp. TaxID=1002546 RepID=UPI003747824D
MPRVTVLTFGLHTRMDNRVQEVVDQIKAGNTYVNRNQIGAIVASQPFGGEGLSGTGPKAGGPNYVERFFQPKQRDVTIEERGGDIAPVSQIQYAIHSLGAEKEKTGKLGSQGLSLCCTQKRLQFAGLI